MPDTAPHAPPFSDNTTGSSARRSSFPDRYDSSFHAVSLFQPSARIRPMPLRRRPERRVFRGPVLRSLRKAAAKVPVYRQKTISRSPFAPPSPLFGVPNTGTEPVARHGPSGKSLRTGGCRSDRIRVSTTVAKLLLEAAEMLRGNIQIGGQHTAGDRLDNIRTVFQHGPVSLHGRAVDQ